MARLRVLRPGILTTVQDLGRWGHQADGVPVAGPMDAYSHRLANRLVANPDDAPALEVTLLGPELEAAGEVTCAVAGAQFELFADAEPMPCGRAFVLGSGRRLRFGRRVAGARATLAVRGGFDVAPVLGSRATSVISGMGPFGGRALARGDELPVGHLEPRSGIVSDGLPLALPQGGARLRTLRGCDEHMFSPDAIEGFFSTRFTIAPASNRTGYRLQGPPVALAGSADILSDATPIGSVQVPRSGQPILLMADRQTTGGYPRIATVISADLPLAGQLAPGDWIHFAAVTRGEALDALQRMERRIGGRRA